MARIYSSGCYTIGREELGIDHGLTWVLRRGSEEITTGRSLKALKRVAASLGVPSDSWSYERVSVSES